MQKTANQIKSSFELLASGHYQIHSFLYAQEFEQQAYENLIYPLMLVYPLGGSLLGTSYTRNYRVVIADRVLKSEGNELEVESDTQLIALDTLAYWMKLGTNERFSITSSNTITPFWEKWGDEVTGHFVDIGIEEFYDFNSCAIPLSSAIPSPTNPCKDARILINSVVYGNAPSDTNFNVVVKNQSGTLVGSLIGGEWIVNTGAGCLDSTYTITNSSGTTLYTGTIPSGGSLTQAISNSTLNVNKSDSTLISSRSILAQGTDSYNVADSTITNAAVNPTYSQLVKATEGLILPTQQIQNNGVASGFIPSVGTINVTTNSAPTSFTITGRTIDIVSPSSSYNLDLIDRFGNALPTKQVSANATWDLRTLTPFDWADLFLSRETSWGVSGFYTDAQARTAITNLVVSLFAANIWSKLHFFLPFVGGTATKHSYSLIYPFNNRTSFNANFVGSPTQNQLGMQTNGSNGLFLGYTPSAIKSGYEFHYGLYSQGGDPLTGFKADFGFNVGFNSGFFLQTRYATNNHYMGIFNDRSVIYTGSDAGYWIGNRLGTSLISMRNSVNIINVTSSVDGNTAVPQSYFITLGGQNTNGGAILNGALRTYSTFHIGDGLTTQNLIDINTIVQAFNTALGRPQ